MVVKQRLVAHRYLSREEHLDLFMFDIFDRNIFTKKRGEFLKGIDVIFYRVLTQMASRYPRKRDLGPIRIQLRKILL